MLKKSTRTLHKYVDTIKKCSNRVTFSRLPKKNLHKMWLDGLSEAKFGFVFGGYAGTAVATAIIFELALIGLRERNRRHAKPEHAYRIAVFALFVMIAAGFDFLRGFGIVQVPQYGEFMSLYRPESYWYFARGVISTLLLLVFEIVERAAATHLSMFFGNRPHMISDSIPGEQTNNNR